MYVKSNKTRGMHFEEVYGTMQQLTDSEIKVRY